LKKQLLLLFLWFAALAGCGGDGSYSDSSQSENSWRTLPRPDQLFGGYSVDAIGTDISCFSNAHLDCVVEPLRFVLERGDYCEDGSYRFGVRPVLVAVTIPAALTPMWEWPRCDRLSYEHRSYLLMETGDVSWNPVKGVMTLRIKSWEQDGLCPNDRPSDLANIWWQGNPWGAIYAEGEVELKFAWNFTTRRFHFFEGECELASRGEMLWYYAGRGEFYAGDLTRRY
jgi:hypothetical protein